MTKIVIQNMNAVEFSVDKQKNILDNIHYQHIDWLHSCGGKGKCTTCKMIIKKGKELLTPKSAIEKQFINQGTLTENERLSCQCRLKSSSSEEDRLVICVAQDNKLPHIAYTTCEES